MTYATNQFSSFRLAIGPGVPSSPLSALLALQRKEEPEVAIVFFEVAGDELVAGLLDGRYDAGISLEGSDDPPLRCQPLWSECMAVAMPLRCPLLTQAKLTVAELMDYPIFQWQAEICPLLEQRLTSLRTTGQPCMVQRVTSFEMMALWVAAGYGVGLSAQSRIGRAYGCGIEMRPLADGPYEIVTHLQRPHSEANSAAERFERRALRVVVAG
ncbi:LysR family substrate-binding domain-containing protein [Xanthomonas axonopodis]|uniref:LysR family substrate-binding domain-containing protein n=1 Tax=Xanthomonas axonopodis TaxID=53413 RepID=UPI0035564D97